MLTIHFEIRGQGMRLHAAPAPLAPAPAHWEFGLYPTRDLPTLTAPLPAADPAAAPICRGCIVVARPGDGAPAALDSDGVETALQAWLGLRTSRKHRLLGIAHGDGRTIAFGRPLADSPAGWQLPVAIDGYRYRVALEAFRWPEHVEWTFELAAVVHHDLAADTICETTFTVPKDQADRRVWHQADLDVVDLAREWVASRPVARTVRAR